MTQVQLRIGARAHTGEFRQWLIEHQVQGPSPDAQEIEAARLWTAAAYRTETGHDADSVLVLIPGGKK